MFLNLNNNRNNQLLYSGKYKYRQKQNSFQDANKRKAYSSSNLKEQFKQFKNKSLSHSNLKLLNESQNERIGQTFKRTNQLKMDWKQEKRHLNEFKKNPLKLDTKLSKCMIHKDNFKRRQNLKVYQNQNQQTKPQQLYCNYRSPQKWSVLSVISSNHLINEIDLLRQNIKFLKLENDQLKYQRKIDLQLISYQTETIRKQQKLIASNQEILIINDLLQKQQTYQRNYQHQQFQKASLHKIINHQCSSCTSCTACTSFSLKQNQLILENEKLLKKISKLQEDKKIMKKQMHSLIFECEKLKQVIKKSQTKYQKQLKHNQKLIKIFYKQEQKNKDKAQIQKPSTSILFNSNQYYPSIKQSFRKQTKDNIQNHKKRYLNLNIHNNNEEYMNQLKEENFHQYNRTQKPLIKDIFMSINKLKAQQIDRIQYLLE